MTRAANSNNANCAASLIERRPSEGFMNKLFMLMSLWRLLYNLFAEFQWCNKAPQIGVWVFKFNFREIFPSRYPNPESDFLFPLNKYGIQWFAVAAILSHQTNDWNKTLRSGEEPIHNNPTLHCNQQCGNTLLSRQLKYSLQIADRSHIGK